MHGATAFTPPIMTVKTRKPGWVIGLDLGQANDFTAITVLDRTVETVNGKITRRLDLRHLQRLKLGTDYPTQVEIVKKLVAALPPRQNAPTLVCDATGVGRPVIDLLRKGGLTPIAVTISGGVQEVDGGNFSWSVPKRNLVSALQIALQSGQLKIARGLAESETLVRELMAFKVRISAAGHDSYSNDWREAPHDDLVLSAALACWYSARAYDGPRQFRHGLLSR